MRLAAKHPRSITHHRGQLFDAVEQFVLPMRRRVAQGRGGVGEIFFENCDRALKMGVGGGAPSRLAPRRLKLVKMNNLGHRWIAAMTNPLSLYHEPGAMPPELQRRGPQVS